MLRLLLFYKRHRPLISVVVAGLLFFGLMLNASIRMKLKKPCPDPTLLRDTSIVSTSATYRVLWEKEDAFGLLETLSWSSYNAFSGESLVLIIPDNDKENCYSGQVITGIDTSTGVEKWHNRDSLASSVYPVLDGFLIRSTRRMEYVHTDGTLIWDSNSDNFRRLLKLIGETNSKWIFEGFSSEYWSLDKESGAIMSEDYHNLDVKAVYNDKMVFLGLNNELNVARDNQIINTYAIPIKEFDYIYAYTNGRNIITFVRRLQEPGILRIYGTASKDILWSEASVIGQSKAFTFDQKHVAYLFENRIRIRDLQNGLVYADIPLYLEGSEAQLADIVTWLGISNDVLFVRLSNPRVTMAISLESVSQRRNRPFGH